ncbi:PepSY-associated TM helix domain-containing protein [Paraglaciecola sp. 2405UD69-4]|uniref:PepSY-associated TM helix domain-containing protein n=1 Tax=Paraglaciecola sp. 2405UD69-4 TaxID=3391836 RepID=UPI0039C9192D
MFRKFVFWSHLVVGICVGLVVFIMSVTGVLLTYEKQIKEWDEARLISMPLAAEHRLTTDQVLDILQQKHPTETHFYIRWVNQEGRPIPAWAGSQRYLISAYSGEILQTGQSWLGEAFHVITEWHRWLGMHGEEKAIGKGITAYSNLLFLFLIISGAYLWLPRNMRWSALKSNFLFKKHSTNRHAKYYNWHHVFGFWALIPLFVVVSTATLFHFDWVNKALYGIYGEEPAKRPQRAVLSSLPAGNLSYDALFELAKQHAAKNTLKEWHSMWLEFGRVEGQLRFYIDPGIGNNPKNAYALFLDVDSGKVASVQKYSDWTPGGRAWTVGRYLHTGEHFGLLGQTIAGLVSLAACFLVYTGFFLSWRRLVTEPYKKRMSSK